MLLGVRKVQGMLLDAILTQVNDMPENCCFHLLSHECAPRYGAFQTVADRPALSVFLPDGQEAPMSAATFARMLLLWPLRRRRFRARQYVFRAGQRRDCLFLVHAGCFKTSMSSPGGRERITGFRLPGDLLGMDALDIPAYACNAVSLDVGEAWELPVARLREAPAEFQHHLAALLAREIRRDWGWMLAAGTLTAEQRVVAFLLDLAMQLERRGFSPRRLSLRMTRADIGSFLGLKLETVTRALSHLQAIGLLGVDRRQITLMDPLRLGAMLEKDRQAAGQDCA
jgi:CRP/FNR family transcriptional regulator